MPIYLNDARYNELVSRISGATGGLLHQESIRMMLGEIADIWPRRILGDSLTYNEGDQVAVLA